MTRYPCPCCGHLVFLEPPGSADICLVCFWEDDATQLRWPTLAGLTNDVCLERAQANYLEFGAVERCFASDVRPPLEEEVREVGWRPIGDEDDFESEGDSQPWPEDRSKLYYWRPSYFRRSPAN